MAKATNRVSLTLATWVQIADAKDTVDIEVHGTVRVLIAIAGAVEDLADDDPGHLLGPGGQTHRVFRGLGTNKVFARLPAAGAAILIVSAYDA